MSASRRKWILWACLCAITVAVFYGGLEGQWVRDDISLIQNNTYISDPSLAGKALRASFWTLSGANPEWNPAYANVYRPVVTAAYIAQGQLFGMKPFGFHVVSLLLHLLCILLAWQWLYERLPDRPGWAKDVAITLGAAVFALHPSRGEVVAWVSGSTDLWMTSFVLLGLLAWNRRDRSPWMAPLAGLSLGLAFLSKEVAIVVPVLIVVDAWCLQGRPLPWKKLLVVGAVSGAVVAARHFVIPLTGAEVTREASSETVRRALSSFGHYVHIAVTEWTPSVQVALRRALPGGEPYYAPWSIWLGAATLASIVCAGVGALRFPKVRPWFADLLWFVLPLAPALNIVDLQAYAMVSERFVYLPLLGISSMIARATMLVFLRRSPVRAVVAGLAIAVLIGYSAVTAVHATHFRDSERLWSYELSVNPDNHAAVKTLELIAWRKGQSERALQYDAQGYEIARRLGESRLAMQFLLQAAQRVMLQTPDWDQETLVNLRTAYDDYLSTNRFSVQTPQLHLDMTTSDAATRDVVALVDLFRFPRSSAWARTGLLPGATEQVRAIVSEHPLRADGWSLLVQLFAQQGKWDEAELALEKMERQLPDHPDTLRTRARFQQARAIADRPADTPKARAMRDADVHAFYGAMHSARLLLDPWVEDHPNDFELVLARAKLDAAERRFEAPRVLLERGRDASAPGERRHWERALAELQSLERASNP